jgi:hypothetical protein
MDSYHYDLFYNKADLAASLVILKKKKSKTKTKTKTKTKMKKTKKNTTLIIC